MSEKVLITEHYLTDIANAIRSKTGSDSVLHPGQMAEAIRGIETYVTPAMTVTKNGISTAHSSVDGYSPVTVNVPGSTLQSNTATANEDVALDSDTYTYREE